MIMTKGTRKTVDLDDDVNEMLREEMRLTGKTLSAVFNDAIRRGSQYNERSQRSHNTETYLSNQFSTENN